MDHANNGPSLGWPVFRPQRTQRRSRVNFIESGMLISDQCLYLYKVSFTSVRFLAP